LNHFRRYYPYRIPLEICCKAVSGKSSNDARGQGKSKESNPKANTIVTTTTCPSAKESGSSSLPANSAFLLFISNRSLLMRAVLSLTGVDFDDLYKRAAVYVEKIFWLTFYKSLSYKNFLKIERFLVSPVFGIITIASGPRRW
jgi:hypothetical protein